MNYGRVATGRAAAAGQKRIAGNWLLKLAGNKPQEPLKPGKLDEAMARSGPSGPLPIGKLEEAMARGPKPKQPVELPPGVDPNSPNLRALGIEGVATKPGKPKPALNPQPPIAGGGTVTPNKGGKKDFTVSHWMDELGADAQKAAKGTLGPAYDQAVGLMRLGQAISPDADIRDMMDGSRDTWQGLKDADPEKVAAGSAAMAAGFAGIFTPGSTGGAKRILKQAKKAGTRGDIADMPYQQRAKHAGPPPQLPKSTEENIERGYKALGTVLRKGEADMAAMHRKDLGWIAFEPGDVRKSATGKIKGGGLSKIVAKHPEDVGMLPEVIAKGKVSFQNTGRGRRSAVVEHGKYKTAFRFEKDGKRETWVLTHFFNEKGVNLLD